MSEKKGTIEERYGRVKRMKILHFPEGTFALQLIHDLMAEREKMKDKNARKIIDAIKYIEVRVNRSKDIGDIEWLHGLVQLLSYKED